MTKTIASEHDEQTLVVGYLTHKYPAAFPYLTAIPNGGVRAWKTAVRLKAEGVSRGFPDLFLALPCRPYHGLMIELKRARGVRGGAKSVTSQEQVDWIVRLNGVGYYAQVCHGADEAMKLIDAYLGGKL